MGSEPHTLLRIPSEDEGVTLGVSVVWIVEVMKLDESSMTEGGVGVCTYKTVRRNIVEEESRTRKCDGNGGRGWVRGIVGTSHLDDEVLRAACAHHGDHAGEAGVRVHRTGYAVVWMVSNRPLS